MQVSARRICCAACWVTDGNPVDKCEHADDDPMCMQMCACVHVSHSLAPMRSRIMAATSPVLSLPALQKNSTGRPASTDSVVQQQEHSKQQRGE